MSLAMMGNDGDVPKLLQTLDQLTHSGPNPQAPDTLKPGR